MTTNMYRSIKSAVGDLTVLRKTAVPAPKPRDRVQGGHSGACRTQLSSLPAILGNSWLSLIATTTTTTPSQALLKKTKQDEDGDVFFI